MKFPLYDINVIKTKISQTTLMNGCIPSFLQLKQTLETIQHGRRNEWAIGRWILAGRM